MSERYFHVGFNFEGRDPPAKKIQEAFDKALDWVKYAPNCYILYTMKDEDIWYRRLREIVHEDDTIFVVELKIENRNGWLPKSVWAWLKKERG